MSRRSSGPLPWELRLYAWCLRSYPAGFREANGEAMRETFVDRRRAADVVGPWRVADTSLECLNLLMEGARFRWAQVTGMAWASELTGWSDGDIGGRKGRMGESIRDLRRTVRTLARRPVWSLLVITTLGAGIASTTAVFSVVDGVALRELPYDAPDDLVRIGGAREGRPGLSSVSGPNFRDLEASATTLSWVAGSTPSSIAMGGDDGPADQLRGGYVSGGFFSALGRAPLLGRAILPSDDLAGALPVAVLSHEMWQARFGGVDVLGRSLRLDGLPVTVVGVMGPDFYPPEGVNLRSTRLWLPLAGAPLPVDERGLSFLDVIGRVAPDATRAQVDAELESIGSGLRERYGLPGRQFSTFRAASLTDETIGTARATVGFLFGAVTLLLVIACANVANLMLVRTIDLSRELAVRVSLGATRSRIVRDVALETLVLTFTGGALGAALAYVGVEAVARVAPVDLPRLDEVSVDGRVLAFTLLLSVLVGVLVGLAPALRAMRTRALESIAGHAHRGSSSRWQGRFRDLLVLTQSAMGLVLLIGAGLLMNSLVRLHGVDPGFATEGLQVLSLRLGGDDLEHGPQAASARHAGLLRAVASVPGVREASLTTGAPFTSGGWTVYVQPDGVELSEQDLMSARIGLHQVSAGHLANLGARLVSGREIEQIDDAGSELVVVISETLAQQYWPSGDALGSLLVVGGDGTFSDRRVVGVVAAPRYSGPASLEEQHIYLPYAQFVPAEIDLMLRLGHLDATTTAALRDAVHQADPGASIRAFGAVDEAMSDYFVEPGFYAWLLTVFAAIALLLSGVGLYGTMAFAVGHRRREFGIRLALGAKAPDLVRVVVVRGLTITGLGVFVGLAGTRVLARTLDGFVFGVSTTDVPTYAFVSLVFLSVGALASWLPARRAGCTQPVESLRLD